MRNTESAVTLFGSRCALFASVADDLERLQQLFNLKMIH
jgi:hypothetical protein